MTRSQRMTLPRGIRALLASALVLVLASAPHALAEADEAAIERGRVIFSATAGNVGCAACHGRFGTGEVGPAIRGVGGDAIATALRNIPEMEFIALSNSDLDDLVAYLAHLGQARPVLVTLRNGDLSTSEVTLTAGSTIQLIITNGDAEAYELFSEALGDHPLAARAVVDLFWTAPDEAGAYTVEFFDSMGVAATLAITTTTE
jgi:mono/diheme cytochrome c family protein